MKKMTVVILTAALVAAIMAGCSGNSDSSSSTASTESKTSTSTTESVDESSKDGSKDTSTVDSSSKSSTSDTSKETSKEGTASKSEESKESTDKEKIAAVTYNNVEIKIDMEVSPLIEKLGEPDYKATIDADEENPNESYSYTYDNMTIYAYLKDEKQYVADVSISGPGDAATANGIKVGASKDAVTEVYGKISDESMAYYEIDKDVIMFIFEDGSVTNISLGRGLDDMDL